MRKGTRFGLARKRVALPLIVLAAALALGLAACGGDDEAAAPAPPSEPAPAPEPPAEPPAPPAEPPAPPAESTPTETSAPPSESGGSVTDYVAYVGGPGGAADTSLTPIKFGFVNQKGGAVEVSPTAGEGVDAAIQYINEQAGGIGGHPIEAVTCLIASNEEEGQQCGQQFANDPDIVAVVTGGMFIGSESLHAALAGSKPVVVGVSVNPVDVTQPTAAILYGDAQYILAPYATFARDTLGVKSAALIYPEGAGLDSPAAGQASAFETAGIPINVVSYPANAPDLSVPLTAADAQNVDLVMPVINPGDCVKFEQAVQQLGIADDKVLGSPICLTPTTIEGLGDFPKWIYAIASSLTFDPTDPAVPPYQEILTSQGREKFIGDPWVNVAFGEVTTLAKWLNGLGPDNITTDGILEQMRAFNGPLVLGSPVIKCGQFPDAPGVCNEYTQFYQYFGADAKPAPMQKVGDWVPPPEGWVAPN